MHNSEKSVLLSPQGDVESMASHCLKLFKDIRFWEEVSKHANEHVQQFDFLEIRNKIITIYRDYLGFEILGASK